MPFTSDSVIWGTWRAPHSPDLKLEWDAEGRRQSVKAPYLFPADVIPERWSRDRMLLAISRGMPLGEAVSAAASAAAEDFQQDLAGEIRAWFATWAASGFFAAAN